MMKLIKCACGCDESLPLYDKKGRKRRFIYGHYSRVKTKAHRKKLSIMTKKIWVERPEIILKPLRIASKKRIGISWGKHTEETKRKISESEKGKIVSLETRKKQRKARIKYIIKFPDKEKERHAKVGAALRGKSQSKEVVDRVKEKWKDPIYKAYRLKQMLRFKNPNRPERKMIRIIRKNRLPYKFVGNGSLILNGYNPDFVSTTRNKLLLEVYGDYWHNRPDWSKRDKKRMKAFKKCGYKTLVFWEHEIVDRKNIRATLTEDDIVRRIIKFQK